MTKDQEMQKNEVLAEKEALTRQIEEMITQNKQQIREMENSTWVRIDSLKDSNKKELAQAIDQSMGQHSLLTITVNNKKEEESKASAKQNEIEKLSEALAQVKRDTNLIQQQIESLNCDLRERDTTIRDKEKKINQLKQKTMDLEKFKFVLDYKIKDLKRQIGPREERI